MSAVLGCIAFLGLVAGLLWILSLPGDDEPEEILGFLAGNWWRFRG